MKPRRHSRSRPAPPPRRRSAPSRAAALQAENAELRRQLAAAKVARKVEQEALEATTARYADLYDFAPVGYITLNRSGVIRDINLVGARLLGAERNYLIGRPLLVFVAGPDRRQFQNYLLRLQKGAGERVAELRFNHRETGLQLFQLTSIISTDRLLNEVYFRTVLTDITERKRIESSIIHLNETMSAMLEAIPDTFFVVGTDGQVRFQNQAATRFLTATALTDLPPAIRVELDQVLTTHKHSLPTDLKNVHRFVMNHEERYFLSRIVCLLGYENQTFGAVAMLQDVTELRLLDEVKTSLISTVSHELKTPITSVRTALMILLEQTFGALNEKQTELLSLARDEGERLLHTLDTLLDLARFESNDMAMRSEKVKPKELVHAAIAAVWGAAANARMQVQTEIEAGLPLLAMDRERMLHVLTNFLTNAIKYSPPASEIIVRARREGPGIYFGVQDQGPGVPEQYRLRIFEKFFRVPGLPAQGAGLGLSIAREFVRAHGGRIGVSSAPAGGSEFFCIVPLKQT